MLSSDEQWQSVRPHYDLNTRVHIVPTHATLPEYAPPPDPHPNVNKALKVYVAAHEAWCMIMCTCSASERVEECSVRERGTKARRSRGGGGLEKWGFVPDLHEMVVEMGCKAA